ncbi:MAG: hypothetical protein IKE70_04815 [Bacilli bacterium]|nr:hypothetical protein [Bacilli bacterium]
MIIKTGYLYHIKDEFFDKINNKGLMINHENGHSRPSYLAIKDDNLLWFIPLSTKIQKYKSIVEKKEKKYGTCKTILIKKIAGREQAILIQNAFPTLEKYIQSMHTIEGKPIKISSAVEKEIIDDFQYMLSLKSNGLNLFFTDIDSIKNIILDKFEQ